MAHLLYSGVKGLDFRGIAAYFTWVSSFFSRSLVVLVEVKEPSDQTKQQVALESLQPKRKTTLVCW